MFFVRIDSLHFGANDERVVILTLFDAERALSEAGRVEAFEPFRKLASGYESAGRAGVAVLFSWRSVQVAHAIERDLDGHPSVAPEAHGLVRGAVELDHVHRARLLMETVGVLGHDDGREAGSLEPGHRQVGRIRLGAGESPLEASPPALHADLAIADIALDRVALRVGRLPDTVRAAEIGDT